MAEKRGRPLGTLLFSSGVGRCMLVGKRQLSGMEYARADQSSAGNSLTRPCGPWIVCDVDRVLYKIDEGGSEPKHPAPASWFSAGPIDASRPPRPHPTGKNKESWTEEPCVAGMSRHPEYLQHPPTRKSCRSSPLGTHAPPIHGGLRPESPDWWESTPKDTTGRQNLTSDWGFQRPTARQTSTVDDSQPAGRSLNLGMNQRTPKYRAEYSQTHQ